MSILKSSVSPVYLCEYFADGRLDLTLSCLTSAESRENGFFVALATLKEGLTSAELVEARCFTRSTSRKLNENECVGG